MTIRTNNRVPTPQIPSPLREFIKAKAHEIGFLRSLSDQMHTRGFLTERQIQAAERIQGNHQRFEDELENRFEENERLTNIVEKFDSARMTGLKKLKMCANGLALKMAGEHSKNPGYIYVNAIQDDVYLGKISPEGVIMLLHRSDIQEDMTRDALMAIERDPLAAAVEYGRKTGRCSCCNRELTNHESIAVGIGPVCREKWGL